MEVLFMIISFAILVGLILSPILIIRRLNKLNIKFKFVTYIIIGIVATSIITFIFAWWGYKSNRILLNHYGYNIDGMGENEYYGNILPENLDRVKSLEKNIMGIGWPLKAIMSYIFYCPYLLIIYILSYWIGNNRQKRYTNNK